MKFSQQYLIVKCEELGDQWECDADRTPICITSNYHPYNRIGYEFWKILPNGECELVKYYSDSKWHE